jgi:hypothetical protein
VLQPSNDEFSGSVSGPVERVVGVYRGNLISTSSRYHHGFGFSGLLQKGPDLPISFRVLTISARYSDMCVT